MDFKALLNTPEYDFIAPIDGFRHRFWIVSDENDIKTVGDILAMGRGSFRALHLVGDKLTRNVGEALKEKYGIASW